MSMPAVGEVAPDFEAITETGETICLSDYKGQKVVLYFYPKADTPGCTTQACRFRDNYGAFTEKGVVVLGASPDTPEAQTEFKTKYKLPFTLIADADHKVAEIYGLYGDHLIIYEGKEYNVTGVRRSTLIIDEDGKVVYSEFGVDPANNTEEVLEQL